MKDDGNWQDVVEAVFGGGEEPQPMIEKPKRHPKSQIGTPSLSLLIARLSLALALLFFLVVVITAVIPTIASILHGPIQCKDMMDWAISRIPARCLAELSEMKPK